MASNHMVLQIRRCYHNSKYGVGLTSDFPYLVSLYLFGESALEESFPYSGRICKRIFWRKSKMKTLQFDYTLRDFASIKNHC